MGEIDETFLTAVRGHHLLNGNTATDELVADARFTTLEGDPIALKTADGTIGITDGPGNSGIIVATDTKGIQAINGIIPIWPENVLIPDVNN